MLKLFAFPFFSDPEKQRRANILVATQVAAVVMMVLIMGISFVLAPDHPEVLLQGTAGATAVIFSFILLKKGKLEIAGWIIVILGWLILTLDLALISGIRGVNILGQVLIVMFAGLAISGKSALIITGINMAANLIVLYLEQSGILVEPTPLPADFSRYIIQSIYTALAAIYIWRADTVIKQAFIETQATADRYRALFERTNDGVLILDLNWCVLNSNPQAADLLGYIDPDLIGLNFSHRLGGNGMIDSSAYLNDILAGSDLPIFENVIQQKNGSDIPVEISMAIVPDSSGDPHHIQCILRDITERKEYERHLVFQTLHDPLTNLPNRKYLEKEFLNINNRRSDDHRLVAVLFIDIDDFKFVNDEHGHQVGDLVLTELGNRLQRSVRDSDTVARMGGDEFVIILENIHTKENVISVAEKIISRISDPFQIQDQTIMITVSIGIDFTEKSDMAEADLIKTSDAALYMVKEDGKNNFRFYDPKNPA
jgi:diguanylate cyclase (GGDEF)-like protein/PAS domain S-box-containing protein